MAAEWKVTWSVSVDGHDVSDVMNDFLEAIEISEKEKHSGDTASLVLDDTDGKCFLPAPGKRVVITLDHVLKFDGWTEEPEWDRARGGGARWHVHCVAHDSRGKVKDPQHWYQDGGTLGDYLKRAAREAGLAGITIDPVFAAIEQPWWGPVGRSFLHVGQALAEELGGIFKVRGDRAVLAARGSGESASGAALASVVFDAAAGDIAHIRARPFKGAASRSKSQASWFDREKGRHQRETEKIDPIKGGPDSAATARYMKADRIGATFHNRGRGKKAGAEKGAVTIEGPLRVTVPIGAPAEVRNTRPGVDGNWKVTAAHHRLTRGGGGTSTHTLDTPAGSVGTDGRKAKKASGTGGTSSQVGDFQTTSSTTSVA